MIKFQLKFTNKEIMIKKIISGGQTGADKAGLDAARDAGIVTGGTAPKGYRICLYDGTDGSDLSLKDFGLEEASTKNYNFRTIKNVITSDGTLWVGYQDSPGGKLTINTCIKYEKPYIINPSVKNLKEWVEENNIEVLNVAGNRLSEHNPNIYKVTYKLVYEFLNI